MDKSVHSGELYLSEWDHRKVGKELELFSFHVEGPGLPFFLPRGIALKNELIDYWRREHRRAGYQEIQSPILLDRKLWEQSGHWDLFKENMYISEVEKRVFALKPMNCPGAILHYKEKKRSHSELPFRVCEMGQVHRDENSGSLHGLMRVRSFVVDDAHIFCAENQLLSEVKDVIALALNILKECGFEKFNIELSVRSPEKAAKYLGSNKEWEVAESVLEQALNDLGLKYKRMEGEAKFYGPAIDLKIEDSAGREWQCSSAQMDFNLPGRFDLSYFDESGQRKVPFILHRCIYGSLERFMGVLIEHHKGELPIWLAPVQLRLLSISSKGADVLAKFVRILDRREVRYEVDFKDGNLSEKVKRAQRWKVPIMILAGDKEAEKGKFSVRFKNGKQRNFISEEEIMSLIF